MLHQFMTKYHNVEIPLCGQPKALMDERAFIMFMEKYIDVITNCCFVLFVRVFYIVHSATGHMGRKNDVPYID